MSWIAPLARIAPIVAVIVLVSAIGGCHHKHHHHTAVKPTVEKPCDLQAPVLTGIAGKGVHQINLTWTKVNGATSYRVVRLDMPTEQVLIETTARSFRVKKLNETHTYQFAVEAVRGTEHKRSNVVTLKARAIPGLEERLLPHGNG